MPASANDVPPMVFTVVTTRTDEHGTITVTSDGSQLQVTSQRRWRIRARPSAAGFLYKESPMSSSNTAAVPASQPGGKRGVIDQIEGDIVVVVFDDEQRLDWPRRSVPSATRRR
jgi:hypothetical protein